MTPAEAREIADETIAYWKRLSPRPTARHVYHQVSGGCRYLGGGWERARAVMIDWILEQDAAARTGRRAA